ncbi:MAG: TA system VapC family ribonuclease toxin [Terriglobales bacterium]
MPSRPRSGLALLDVNVLVALAWPNHQFHRASQAFLGANRPWATCALTQLGFIRLSANPAAVTPAQTPSAAAELLAQLTADPFHRDLDRLPAPAGDACRAGFFAILGYRQVADSYLLSLAAAQGAERVTVDRRIEHLAAGRQPVRVLG